MKNQVLKIVLAAILSFYGFQNVQSQKEVIYEKSQQDQHIKKAELTVTGMTCQKGCADGIDKKLKKTEGIIRSSTKLDTGICKVTFDESKISIDQIISVIEGMGYKAKQKV